MSEAARVMCLLSIVTAGVAAAGAVSAQIRAAGTAAAAAARECTKCRRLRIMRAPGVLVARAKLCGSGDRRVTAYLRRTGTPAKTTLFAWPIWAAAKRSWGADSAKIPEGNFLP